MTIQKELEWRLVLLGINELDAEIIIDLAIPEINKIDGYHLYFKTSRTQFKPSEYRLFLTKIYPIAIKYLKNNSSNTDNIDKVINHINNIDKIINTYKR
jgi:hypothetical protein